MNDLLKDRDYTLILDKSASMGFNKDTPSGKSRWDVCQENTLGLVSKLCELDPDGITLIPFNGGFKRHENVTVDAVAGVFKEHTPQGSTSLAAPLKSAFDDYFARKAAGKTKANGDMIVVVTDGQPDDQDDVIKEIVAAMKKMDRDEELAVGFIQVGRDGGATAFLKRLDDDLVSKHGAKFDAVDTVTAADAETLSFEDLLVKFITD